MGKAYVKLREEIKKRGGSMTHHKKGRPQGGSWKIKLHNTERWFDSDGGLYRELDTCYVPKPGVKNPKKWGDYSSKIDQRKVNKFLKQFK